MNHVRAVPVSKRLPRTAQTPIRLYFESIKFCTLPRMTDRQLVSLGEQTSSTPIKASWAMTPMHSLTSAVLLISPLKILQTASNVTCWMTSHSTHPRLVDRAATEQTNRLNLEPARPGECVVSAVVRNPANAQNFHMCGSGGKCRPRSRVRE